MAGAGKAVPGCDVRGRFPPHRSPGAAPAARAHLPQKDAALRATCTLGGKPIRLQQSSSGGAGAMKTRRGGRGWCSSSSYRLTANQMGKTCDQQRTNLGKMTPLSREPVGHRAVSQAELLLQKQCRSLKKTTREPGGEKGAIESDWSTLG